MATKVIIALAKNAGCLQNGSCMLLLTWTYLVSCLFCKRGKKRERVACAIHFASTQHFSQSYYNSGGEDSSWWKNYLRAFLPDELLRCPRHCLTDWQPIYVEGVNEDARVGGEMEDGLCCKVQKVEMISQQTCTWLQLPTPFEYERITDTC